MLSRGFRGNLGGATGDGQRKNVATFFRVPRKPQRENIL